MAPLICVKKIINLELLKEEANPDIKAQCLKDILHWKVRVEGILIICQSTLEGIQKKKDNYPKQHNMVHFFSNCIIPYFNFSVCIIEGLIDNVIFPFLEADQSPTEKAYFNKYFADEDLKKKFKADISSEFNSQTFIEKAEKRNKGIGLFILGWGNIFLLNLFSGFEKARNSIFPRIGELELTKAKDINKYFNLNNLAATLPVY